MILTSLVDVELVVAANFIAYSRASKEALKSANILKSLQVDVLIEGPKGVGKETLARYISPNANILKNESDLKKITKKSSDLIILNIENFKNLHLLTSLSKEHRVIATSNKSTKSEILDKIFSIKIFLPPYSQRKEDILPLAKKFLEEANEIFSQNIDLDLKEIDFNLSENGDSIKRDVFFNSFLKDIDDKRLIDCMERFLANKLGTKNDYKEFLYLYEIPLIRVGFKKFKSQLKMAKMFGLNRNTLRKKINDYEERL